MEDRDKKGRLMKGHPNLNVDFKGCFQKGHKGFINNQGGFKKGQIPWNDGLTKETDERLKKAGEKSSETKKRLYAEGKLKARNKIIFSEEQKQEIRRLYEKDLYNASKIGNIFGCSSYKILPVLKEMNILKKRQSFSEETRKNMSESRLKGIKEGRIFTEEHKKNDSKSLKQKWENQEYRENQLKSILKGLMKRPTSFEKKIAGLCIENSLSFVYTGNGQFLINFKNPDFVNHQDKVVIEVFYSYFKIRDYGSVENYKEYCRKKYNSAGWNVIFIDENEVDVDNWKELCLNKIQLNFNRRKFLCQK